MFYEKLLSYLLLQLVLLVRLLPFLSKVRESLQQVSLKVSQQFKLKAAVSPTA